MRRMKRISLLILSAAMTIGIGTVSYAGQWQSNSTGWWWQEDDGTWPANGWKEINGKYYYFDSNGYLMTNTTTPDGYQVGVDGAWIPNTKQTDNMHTIRASDPYSVNLYMDAGPENYLPENHAGEMCNVISNNQLTFKFSSENSNLDPTNHTISITAFTEVESGIYALGFNGDPYMVNYDFEYDKDFSLDFTGTHSTAQALSDYCIANNIIIKVEIRDNLNSEQTIGPVFYLCYASSNSIYK